MVVKNLNLRVAVWLDEAIVQHERDRHGRLGDDAAGRKRIDRAGSYISRAQRPGPIQHNAPEQPAHEHRRAGEADETAEAADIFDRDLPDTVQRIVESRQRLFIRIDKLFEEQRRNAPPSPFDDDSADVFRMDIETRPGKRQVGRAQLGPALADARQRLHPDRAPADCRLPGRACSDQGGDIDPPRVTHDVRFLAEMHEVVHPPPLQRDRPITTIGTHLRLAPKPQRDIGRFTLVVH